MSDRDRTADENAALSAASLRINASLDLETVRFSPLWGVRAHMG